MRIIEQKGEIKMDIAIIGMGIGGGATLRALFECGALKEGDSVDIYEDRKDLGVGAAYQEDSLNLIMNSYPRDLSQNPNDRYDFSKWLETNYPGEYGEESFVPRAIYGRYLKECFTPYLERDQVTHIPQRVTGIDLYQRGTDQLARTRLDYPYTYELESADGQKKIYDAVFYQGGNPPYADYYDLIGTEHYIHDPFPVSEKLIHLSPEERIAVLGSGLTALDIIEFVIENYDLKHPVYSYTVDDFTTIKSGIPDKEISYSLNETWLNTVLQENHGFLPLDEMIAAMTYDFETNGIDTEYLKEHFMDGSLDTIRKELAQRDEQLKLIQSYMIYFSVDLDDFLALMTKNDYDRFFEEHNSFIHQFHLLFSPEKMSKIVRWVDEGKLLFVKPSLDIKTLDDGTFQIIAGTDEQSYSADVIINCTGFIADLKEAGEQDPLIKEMYEKRIALPTPKKDMTVSWPNRQLISDNLGELNHFYVGGAWIGSTAYPINNARKVSIYGREAVEVFKAQRQD